MMYELCHCSHHQDGNTALHLAARDDKASCVRALLSHPGIDINIKNGERQTAMMVAGYTSLGVFKEMKACKDFPVDSYGKIVLCGSSGAGKSTMTQVGCLMKSGTAVLLPTVHVHVCTGSNILYRSGFRNIYMYELNYN